MRKCRKMMRQGLLYGAMLLWLSFLAQCSNDDGPDMKAPVLTVEEAKSVTRTTADVSGIIDANGNSIGECGFYYSVAKSDLTSGSEENVKKKPVPSQSGTVNVRLEGLEPNTTYFYCLYAKSGKTKVQSEIRSFKTLELGVPVLNDIELVEADAHSLRVSCSIAHNGGAELKEFGFQYRKENETAWKAMLADVFDEGSSSKFTLVISDLEPDTDYRVRAFAKNTRLTDNGYSSEEGALYHTEALLAPTVSIFPLTDENLGANWVKVVGNIESKGASAEVSGYGFCWSVENENPTVADSKQDVPVDADRFTATIDGLVPGKSYHLCAFASNKVDGKTRYGYSEPITFTTKEFFAPELDKVECSNVTAYGADLSCKLINSGNGTVIERGFCWSTTEYEPQIVTGKHDGMCELEEGADFVYVMKDLKSETTYYVRAYATATVGNATVTGYSSYQGFTTTGLEKAGINMPQAAEVTATSFTLTASLYSTGNTDITETGFCWSTSQEQNPETLEKHKAALAEDGKSFSLAVSEQPEGAVYYVWAYATNGAGTVYSGPIEVALKGQPGADDNVTPEVL